MILTHAARSIVLLMGWPRLLLAVVSGALGALALPPFGLFPVLAVSFPVLILLIDGCGTARSRPGSLVSAFGLGWCYGFGYHLAGLWWIGSAFLVEADRFAVFLPFAVLAMPAGLAIFTGIGVAVARFLWAPRAWRILSLALGLMLAEYARSVLFTGFPWNLYGSALTQNLYLAQGVAYIGINGMTFVTLVLLSSPLVLVDETITARVKSSILSAAMLCLIGLAIFGSWRVSQNPTVMVPDVKLRLVQPNIPQDAKFRPEAKARVMKHYLDLSNVRRSEAVQGVKDVTHLIWPESAFPFLLIYDAEALGQIASLLPEGTTLLTGAIRPETDKTGDRPTKFYNSVYMIDHNGEITATYDKINLVPFGEFLPFQGLMESLGFEQLTRQRGGFSAGENRRLFKLDHAPSLSPLICYEIIFSGILRSLPERPGWILNVTNDAWFGVTPGPYQHAHNATLRAIEEGIPVVRASNNGISLVVDPVGRVVSMLPLNVIDVLDSRLPRTIEKTIYSIIGDWLLFFTGLLILKVVWRRRLYASN